MTEDYGYGDTTSPDYGYGDAAVEYGYGDADAAAPPDMDYGYGDNASAPNTDYGYGDDAGPGDVAPVKLPTETRKPKRRCSVTKYSLVSTATVEGSAEAEMATQIQQAEILQNLRNGGAPRPLPPRPTRSEYSTASADAFPTDVTPTPESATAVPVKKGKGKLRRLRKRLSMF
jgi:hypothetical protein